MEQPNNEEPAHPYAKIVVQPYGVSRFQDGGGRTNNGVIVGANSSQETRTYPKIKVFNYIGPVEIRVSCVDKKFPFRTHPHKLVGPHCQHGVYRNRYKITEAQHEVEVKDIAIAHVTIEHVEESLQLRRQLNVNPFKKFSLAADSTDISSSQSVRLAIEVFQPDNGGRFLIPMLYIPLVTDVITDRKMRLVICYASRCAGSVRGGSELALFTETLPRAGVMVRFFEESTGWEVEVSPKQIHKMCGMVVDVPPYRNPDTSIPICVKVEIRRNPADATDTPSRSNQIYLEYTPEWAPPRRRRLLTCTANSSEVSEAKRKRTDEKSLHSSLLKDFDESPPANTVEEIFRENGAQQQPRECDVEPDSNAVDPNQYSRNTENLGQTPPSEPSPLLEQSQYSQINKPSEASLSPKMNQSPQMVQSPQMGPLSQAGLTPQMVQSPQMGPLSQAGLSHQMVQSLQMGPLSQAGLTPQMVQSPQMGPLSQAGLSPQMVQFLQMGPLSQAGLSPQMVQSPQMGPLSQAGLSPQMVQSLQMGPLSQAGLSPQMVQSPQMGPLSQAGLSPQMVQSLQMGPLSQAGLSPQMVQSPQMGPLSQAGLSPQMVQSLQMGPLSQAGLSPQMVQSNQMGPLSQAGLSPQMVQSPQLRLLHQVGICTETGQFYQMFQSPPMKQSPQTGLCSETGQSYQTVQSPPIGQTLQMGQSPVQAGKFFPITQSLVGQPSQIGQSLQTSMDIPIEERIPFQIDRQIFDRISGAEDINTLLSSDSHHNDPILCPNGLADKLANLSNNSPESTMEL